MAIKKLNLKKNCVICHKKINFKKDRYVNIRDYNGKVFEAECFYHLECWKNRFAIQQQKALEFINPMVKKLNTMMGGKEVFEVC